MKVSDCCGAENGPASEDGPNWMDIDLCPACREHCGWLDADEQEGENEQTA